MSWSCVYCTLLNDPAFLLCQGCGSQKPVEKKAKGFQRFLTDSIKEVGNVVSDLWDVSSRRMAPHNIVRIPEGQTALPNGPPILPADIISSSQSSSSTFFVPNPVESERYQNLCSEDTMKVKRDVEEKSEKVYEDILDFCRTNQTTFIDDSFPHSSRSIGVLKFRRNGRQQEEVPTFLEWLRPNQMFTKDGRSCPWTVLNNPVPSDIEQGTLVGDCWLMSAMAVIAERPNILDDIFPSKEYSHQGVYRVKICVEGEWKVMIVDDFFPCYTGTRNMAMAVGRRNQLWVSLIEKALAKAMGSYSKLHGASLTQGLSMLTGASCVNYDSPENPAEIDTFWAQLISSKFSGFLMCCVCATKPGTYSDEDFRAKGLLTNHAYSLLDVNDQHGPRLLRVRNPWGQFVWNGKWSDNWPNWPSTMKQSLLSNRRGETGAFWIELDDFISMFTFVTVCKNRVNWSEFRHRQIVGLNTLIVQLIVTETCETTFMAFQKGSFALKDETVNDMMLSVHRISSKNVVGEMIARSSRLSQRYVNTDEFFLHPGHYVVMVFDLKNNNRRKFDVNLVCHSSKPIFYDTIRQSPKMFNQALREIVIKDGDMVSNTEPGIVIRTLTKHFRGMIIMADNSLENRWLHLDVDCHESMNIESSRRSLHTTDVIPPMSYEIVVVLSTIDDLAQYRVANSLKSIVHRKKYIGPEMNYEASIIHPKLQHFPIVDSSDILHSAQNLFYET